MAKIYDISARITNELPTMKISDDLIVTVNNRKNTVLNVLAMTKEAEKKREEENDAEADFKMMQKALSMLIGAKNAKAVDDMDLPVNEYAYLFKAVMAAAQGEEPEDMDNPTP